MRLRERGMSTSKTCLTFHYEQGNYSNGIDLVEYVDNLFTLIGRRSKFPRPHRQIINITKRRTDVSILSKDLHRVQL